MENKVQGVNPFDWLLGSAALVVVLAGLRAAQSLVVPFLIAAFLAVICTPALHWLQRKGVPGWLAILVVGLAVSVALLLVVIVMTGSINEFVKQAPKYEQNLAAREGELVAWLKKSYSSLAVDIGAMFNASAVISATKTVLNSLVSAFGNVFLVLLTVLFMLMETAGLHRKLIVLSVGNDHLLQRVDTVRESIVRYTSLKTLLSLATGVLVGAWVWGLGIDFPLLWGLLAFLLNYVPNVGSILAAIPVVCLAVVQYGFSTAVVAAVGYLVINLVIGNFIEPRMMGKGLGLSTLVVFISLVVWGWVLGPVGMLLSVPLTMIVKIVMEGFDETRWLAVLLAANPEGGRATNQS